MRITRRQLRKLILENMTSRVDDLAIELMQSGEYEDYHDAVMAAANQLGPDYVQQELQDREEYANQALEYYESQPEPMSIRDPRHGMHRAYMGRVGDEDRRYSRSMRENSLRDFKFTGQDFTDDLNLLGGDTPPVEPEERSGGGGSAKIHQLVRVDFSNNPDGSSREFDASSYTKAPITGVGEASKLAREAYFKMQTIFDTFEPATIEALYSLTPGLIDNASPDSETVWEFRSAYYDLLNTMDNAVPGGGDYEYFAVYHPEHSSYRGLYGQEGVDRALKLYEDVTGYRPNEEALEEYEFITHCASAMFG